MNIIVLQPEHWLDVRRIYLEGIATGQATFQTEAPEWEDWNKSHLADLRFIAITGTGKVAGWVALAPVSNRCVYAGVAEVSVYVSESFRGHKVGQALLQHLIIKSEKANLWTLQAGIFPENEASVKLHEKLGFRIIGYREKVAKQYGVWRDVYLLEKRSNSVGID
ncbi:N-acetyltransferase family protein [Mucilaginibacter daejeonensis]|uniref:GNAT family N-acetyltransferase n=1 Tax=Mucilaginibacter daejeonensis TaxID=398049 RepID=UPI001D1791F8|nr:GNAT family N-acetyltransferase [Mucilaginibacter daejeonensis]UEG51429.1 N-acetyltransferase family protein [Mucilaginibacter daejeonensis]